jgi:hypothetical protein
MRVRLADGTDHEAVPLEPGTLVMEPPATSDTSVWVITAEGAKRKLTFAEFTGLFPAAADTKEQRAEKRDALIQRVGREMLSLVPDHGSASPGDEQFLPVTAGGGSASSEPPAPVGHNLRPGGRIERLRDAAARVYSAGGKADGLPLHLPLLSERMASTPVSLIEDKIRHFNTWADAQLANNDQEPRPSIAALSPAQAPGDYMSGNIYISSPELSDWSSRSGSIRGHMEKWIDEKLKTGHGAHHELGVDLGDQRELDKLHDWLEVLESNDKQLHLWAQGDREHQERGQPRADWNRLLNRTENLAEVLRGYPGTVSLGIGFDTFEWVPGAASGDYSRFHEWVGEMRSLVPWLLVGGRPQGAWDTNPRHLLSRGWAQAWNAHSSYFSIEGGVVTESFVRSVRSEADRLGLPAMSENRDRLGNTPEAGLSHGYSYSESQLVDAIRWYRQNRVAGIIANWRNRATRDHPRATRELPAGVYAAIETPLGPA